MLKRAQGSTEYLVVLALVLLISLVSIALLGFFPDTALDNQITQSQTYWRSSTPIAITEFGARAPGSNSQSTSPYLRIQNTGSYPIRITAVYGGGQPVYTFWNGTELKNISDHFYVQPGEIIFFGKAELFNGLPDSREIDFSPSSSCGGPNPGMNAVLGSCSAKQFCSSDMNSQNPGIFTADLGFEYIEYIDNNNHVIKRQNGSKTLMVKCMSASECQGGCSAGQTCLPGGVCCLSSKVCGSACCGPTEFCNNGVYPPVCI